MIGFFNKANFCKAPFEQIIIQQNGDIFFCCPPLWNTNAVLGNIYNRSFEKIWNSDIAKKIRKNTLKNIYPYCKYELCNMRTSGDSIIKSFLSKKKIKYKTKMSSYPRFVVFSNDFECNVSCITCRKDVYRNSDIDIEKMQENIETIFLPILRNTEIVMMNQSGEALASKYSRIIIKAISQNYPNIKFALLTNGILCNKMNLIELGIEDKISSVIVSLNAATKETYDKFVIGGNYELVMRNLEYLKEKIKLGSCNCIIISFVITSINYKEIPAFIDFAEQNGFHIQFLHYVDWGVELRYPPNYLAVHKPSHPEFENYLKIYKQYIIPYLKKSFNYIKES